MSPSLVSESVLSDSAAESMTMKSIEEAPRDFIYRSKLPDIDIPNHMPLADYCLEKASQWADKVCLIDGNTGKEHRYGEIELSTRRVAAGLAELGVPQGGVIALLLPNCAEFVTVFLGAAKRGAIVTTANPFYTAAELEKQIVASGATVVVTQSSYVDKLAGLNVQVSHKNFHSRNHSILLQHVLNLSSKITATQNGCHNHQKKMNPRQLLPCRLTVDVWLI